MQYIFLFELLAYCQSVFVLYLVPAATVIGDWDNGLKSFISVCVMYVYSFPRQLIVGVIELIELLSK
jgi:hypothetical protein